MDVLAPAKINLTLRVLGKRPDGYHTLESVMQMLSLADRLTIETGGVGIQFSCSDPTLETEENLVVRAARLLEPHCAIPRGAQIHLEKRIPMQAGLGGGSSDAAATLLALNELWEIRLTPDDLAALAAQLGSDVPFFLAGPTAVVQGRGESITPAFHAMTVHVVIAKPATGLSTPAVYGALSAPTITIDYTPHIQVETNTMLQALAHENLDAVANALVNDLEGPALNLMPALFRVRERMLEEGCLNVLLCGSGSAVFGICPDAHTAERAAAILTNDVPWTWAGSWLHYR